jgi:hypothetical protein
MPFCSKCGNPVDGKFCEKCGTPVAAVPPPPVAAPAMTMPPQQAAPVKKKTSPLVWILVGVLGLFVLGGLALVAVGGYFAHKVGKNPAVAAARMMAMANPDVEVLEADEDTGVLTLRDKKTGKTITMNAADIQKGKLTFSDGETGEKVSIGGDTANLPPWVPKYPGSKPGPVVAIASSGGSVTLLTNDSVDRVLDYYEKELKSAGFEVTRQELGGVKNVTAKDSGGERSIHVIVTATNGSSTIMLNYKTKE